MVGRVPVKATAENGPIMRGDLLVSSPLRGYAMKYDSTKDNDLKMVGVVGVALENLSGGTGKIMALIRTGWVYNRKIKPWPHSSKICRRWLRRRVLL